jgi:uncharacterized OB-fold protein
LLGTRCRPCGKAFHPSVSICFECLGSDLEAVPLARAGTLEFTTVHMPAERIAAPYTVGYVKLLEGLRIFAPIVASGAALAVGMPMRLAEFTLGAERPRRWPTASCPSAARARHECAESARSLRRRYGTVASAASWSGRSTSSAARRARCVARPWRSRRARSRPYGSRVFIDQITAQVALRGLGITGIEMINVENAWAGGATAVRCRGKTSPRGCMTSAPPSASSR